MAYVYDVLNKLKWGGRLGSCEIVILHRGAPGDRKTVAGGNVTQVRKGHLEYVNERGEETFIPYHRVLEVRVKGKPVWEKGK
ncbi:MAG: DUF504 domain-containing protein [Candidatus Aenigmatarchaeota archaeon]